MPAYILGSGMHVPEEIVTNEELAEHLNLEPEQIVRSSGIRRRRWADPQTTTSSMAASALRLALEDARLVAEDIDYLLLGTMTPDRFIPGSASAVQKSVGLREIPCLDIHAACCNMLYTLDLARSLTTAGVARMVAICLSEIQSRYLELSPEASSISMLFGDGASALIISAEGGRSSLQIIDLMLATDGTYVDHLGIRCPGTEFGPARPHESSANHNDYFARMQGRSVITHASRKMVAACQVVLKRNKLSANDVRWVVPHQANANLLSLVARKLCFAREDGGIVSVLEEYGNTSSASMGIALDTLLRSGRIKAGDYILLPAFGAGFTWGVALCRA